MKTALNAFRTPANGCDVGTIAGCTRTEMASSPVRSTTARSFTAYPKRSANSTSTARIPEMPSRMTSALATSYPKATPARMAALAAASKPSTSAVGSRSASPSAWASARASA